MSAKLFDAFHKEEQMPMMTVQRQMNQRKPTSHKFWRAAKNYKLKNKSKNDRAYKMQTGRVPNDIKERYMEKIPPRRRIGPMG